ncbi:MAG: leucine-rich repeat protein [Oscillospiraceae bacterium]|nr:leucine-rich repeat protein [Oscillospiraceae bacterium]
MNAKAKRMGAALLAAVSQSMMLLQMPFSAEAAGIRPQSLADFTAAVQALTVQDTDRALFTEIVYDKAAGTLSADGGKAQKSCGDLSVRGGELMLRTGAAAGGISVQSGSNYEPFDEAAAAYGYTAEAKGDTVTITNEFQTARLIVKAAGKIDTFGAESAAEGYHDLHILQYADAAAAFAAYQRYQDDPAVQYVQPSHRVRLDEDALAASEKYAETLKKDTKKDYMTWGAGYIGTEDFISAYLDAEVLPQVTVAVIDTGINASPALFQGRILDGGINISDSGDDTVQDDLSHGTHVTGTICELTPPNVKILPVKVFSLSGTASDEQIYLGLMYALEQKADILNMSFGGLGVSPLEVEAMHIADENGIICCAAAGNNGDDAGYYYPGSIDSCITVGAVNSDMQRAGFSNFGKSVDMVAPGVGIVSYVLGTAQETDTKNGTSMATPHVSACCALLRSYDKTITPRRAEALLRVNAVDLGEAGFDSDYAWGLVNMSDFRWDDGICPAPEISLKSGSYGQAQTVSLKTELEDAAIYYTTDGSIPSAENGTRYTEPITVSESVRLLAVTVQNGWITSTPAEGIYMIGGRDTANAFSVSNGVLTAYRGIRKTLTVPETINGQTVRAIGEGAFRDNHVTEQITLPETVTEIGAHAFENCRLLKKITAPAVKTVGDGAFADDSLLESVKTAETMQSLGSAAFSGCTALTAFSGAGVAVLPDAVFCGCESLERTAFPDVRQIGASAFADCAKLTATEIRWETVTEIGEAAFSGCQIYACALQLSALEKIGASAFENCASLRRISLPETITALPEDVFAGCSGLCLLQLPAVTEIGARALAFSASSELRTELSYDRLTAVGADAFRGFRIGGYYDTTEFTSLITMQENAFAGVQAGGLSFPQIKTVPANAFADASVSIISLENAQTIGAGSLTGCRAVVLTAAAEQIAPDALPDEMIVVTLDEIPALRAFSALQLCNEPLVMRVSKQELSCTQHSPAALSVLAGGVGLHYQWYLTDGTQKQAIEGAVSSVYVPDTASAGTRNYLCIATDEGKKTERAEFSVTVTAEQDAEPLVPEQLTDFSGTQISRMPVSVAESGTYRLTVSGTAAVSGILTDASGRTVGALTHGFADEMTVLLAAGDVYYLQIAAMWEGSYALLLTKDTARPCPLKDCTVVMKAPEAAFYGAEIMPSVTVSAPDGNPLTEGRDYELRLSQHNQWLRAAIYGKGAYSGCLEAETPVIRRVQADTPIPVQLEHSEDTAVYSFVPAVSGTYHFYATYAEGYAAEMTNYLRTGRYNSGTRYISMHTKCVVSDTPDASGTVFAENSYSVVTGNLFRSEVKLNAGQTYYFICSADHAAAYSLVITQNDYDLRKAVMQGNFNAIYDENRSAYPKFTVTADGKTLTEGRDYLRVDNLNDVPGQAKLMIAGTGLYYGTADRSYTVYFFDAYPPESFTALDTPVTVTGSDRRLTLIWFRADRGETAGHRVRYRILNNRKSGSPMRCTMFRYDEESQMLTELSPLSEISSDYMLRNGIYCVAVCRQYANAAAQAEISILQPYNLEEVTLSIDRAVYTGDAIPAPVTVTAPDGTILEDKKDFRFVYPDENTLFGETPFELIETERSFGRQSGSFMIDVSLPEDAPLLTVGAHEAHVTKEERLAVYRVTAETETVYTLTSDHAENLVLRVFSPEAELLEQDYGNGTNSVKFTVPAGEMRYVMVKFNGTDREGTIRFRLDTELHLLSDCKAEAAAQVWTGEQLAPQVTFYDGDVLLTEGEDYRLRYTADDVNIGTATANYIGIGKYFGTVDVTFPITAPDLLHIEELDAVPLMLNHVYSPKKNDDEMLLYSYTAGTDTALHLIVRDAYCKLTLQRYDADGVFQDSQFFKPECTEDVALKAGETCYFLFTATDIASWNQTFRMVVHDSNSDNFETVTDEAGGFSYRIAKDGSYAEALGFSASPLPEQLTLQKEIGGVPVSFVPASLFTEIPADTVVIGYAGCGVEEYADQYLFIYQQSGEAEQSIAGDINRDGRCSPADVVLLAGVLSENQALDPALLDSGQLDLNGDGLLDIIDLTVLLRMLHED